MFKAKDLLQQINSNGYWRGHRQGILFCFGKSFISKIIQAKTRKDENEIVPSHIALFYDDYIYESTTERVDINGKHIKSGVRRWQLKDFIASELKKETEYELMPCILDVNTMENYVHYPYGKDIIIDYLFTNGSDGESDGLICSQYANYVTKLYPNRECVTPADMYRFYLHLIS